MGAIMMDNWSIESAFAFLKLNNELEEEMYIDSWIDFMTALVLWDEIWYLNDSMSLLWENQIRNGKSLEKLASIMHPIDKALIDDSIVKRLTKASTSPVLSYPEEAPSIINQRTYLYKLLSNALGINVLLHNKRSELINDINSISLFDRLDIFRTIDRDLQEYYEYVNGMLGRKYLSFSYPVLYDYIRNRTYSSNLFSSKDKKLDELEAALEIRRAKDVVLFRDEVEHIENLVNSGDTQALLTQLNLLDEIAKDISNKYNKSITLAEFKLSLTPSLSRTFPIKIKYNKNMKIHTSFIKKMFTFGINSRRDM